LLGRIYGRSSIKIAEIVWPMKPNLVGSIYGKSSVAMAHFVKQKQELSVAAMFVSGLGQNEQSL
jgi:hypothetical protein